MTETEAVLQSLVIAMLALPALLFASLGIPSIFGPARSERSVGRLARVSMSLTFLLSVAALFIYFKSGAPAHRHAAGSWFSSPAGSFSVDLLIDGQALGFACLIAGICGVVASFSHRYLHRETGYNRYFCLFSIFVTGMLLIAFAGSIEVLLAGWEMVGLSSALLVGFFHDRPAPVSNAMRIFAIYRIGDAAMLAAAVLIHRWTGSGSLAVLFSNQGETTMPLIGVEAAIVGGLLIIAVAGKSALFPFSSWLPRAMEGPTPSSAVYYGALSIHAGCFLLLRAEPLLASSPAARALAIAIGVATVLYATLAVRVQSDIKSSLAHAALIQVGIIVIEIALGLTTLAFIHIVGHACFRLLQLLSAPNILHDLHEIENAIRAPHPARVEPRHNRPVPGRLKALPIYLISLERGFLDAAMDRFVVFPLKRIGHACDRMDRLLCGDHAPHSSGLHSAHFTPDGESLAWEEDSNDD